MRAALLAGLSLTVLTYVQPASAWNGDFWPGFNRNTPAADIDRAEPKKKAKKKADTTGEKKAAERAATIPSGPLHIVVSIDKQRVTLFADGKPFANAPVSTGTAGHPTPTGIFSVIQKNKHHVSNLYDASMPYMQRITWSGVAMHTGPLPGYAASHGCVRLPNEFAQMLWKATKIGARVVVAKPEVAPVEIEHPNLFVRRAKMADMPSLKVAEVQQAMAQAAPQPAPRVAAQVPVAEPATPRPVTPPVRLADGAKLVPGAIIGDSVQPVGSVGMVYRPEEEAAKLAAEQNKTEEPAVEVAAAPELVKPVETKPAEPVVVAEPSKPAEPVKVAEPAKPVEITTSIRIIKDEPGQAAKKPEIAKAPEPAKPAVVATPAPAKPAIEERTAAAEVMPTAKPVKQTPISIFISRKEAKLYVRRDMEPLFDTPVAIKDADKPIGTHVYTAMNLKDDGASMRWTVVSIPSSYARDTAKGEKNDKKASKHDKPVKAAAVEHTPEPSAKEALDRLDIAPDTLARIETMMMPGSSLIVSDNKLSDETGKGTDFIVVTR
ncbi:MAG: L,D-transpeptidase family protein [Pseudomonadota bacterium]